MLKELVKRYQVEYAPHMDSHIAFYAKMMDNRDTYIHYLAFAIDEKNKTHPHQRRVSKETKLQLEHYLHMNLESIIEAADFDLTFHKLMKLPGIGKLTAYDTAIRLGLTPEKIYLHTGSLLGAHALFDALDQTGKLDGADILDINDFPEALHTLPPLHIEHFLCKFKNDFGG